MSNSNLPLKDSMSKPSSPPRKHGPGNDSGRFYTPGFYSFHADRSRRSAARVVPFIVDRLNCKSVLDVGCGDGAWLAAFRQCGIADLRGLDGDYVHPDRLVIPPEDFKAVDLRGNWNCGRKFDLVVSLEVAEHLPPENAEAFVGALADHGDVVLFSAAIPGQGGTYHLNEQWPDYWSRLFAHRGYLQCDWIRLRFWDDPDVEWWYVQNAFVYINQSKLAQYKAADSLKAHRALDGLSVVHPRLLEMARQEIADLRRQPPTGWLVRSIPAALTRSFRRRWRRWMHPD